MRQPRHGDGEHQPRTRCRCPRFPGQHQPQIRPPPWGTSPPRPSIAACPPRTLLPSPSRMFS